MTLDDINVLWERYAHRYDLEYTDFDLLKELVDGRILDELQLTDPDLDDVLGAAPAVYLHGGLMFLNEESQDDEGVLREMRLFRDALHAYERGYSTRNTAAGAKMTLPYTT